MPIEWFDPGRYAGRAGMSRAGAAGGAVAAAFSIHSHRRVLPTDALAETILSTNTVTDDAGTNYPLHSHTSRDQCEVLQRLIRQSRPKVSLEVGLAYGISTLNICQALREVGANKHIVMDPFQANWKEIGLRNIRVAGYEDLVEFRREM